MTEREGVVISAFTGILVGGFSPLHEYIEELMGRPVFTHEIPSISEELKELSKPEFIEICKSISEGA